VQVWRTLPRPPARARPPDLRTALARAMTALA